MRSAPESFYFQASNGSVALPVAGYNYNSDWTPLLAGLSPARMAASLAAPNPSEPNSGTRLPPWVSTATICCRMRASIFDTLMRRSVRRVRCWSAFPLVSALRSTGSAAVRSALFVGFTDASHNGIAHVAFDHENNLRSREFIISWLTTPHATAVYARCSASPPPHATLASRRLARPYLGGRLRGWRRAVRSGQ